MEEPSQRSLNVLDVGIDGAWTEGWRKPCVCSTLPDRGSSISGTTGVYNEGEMPKVRGPPLAQFLRGIQVRTALQSEDPAAPASSRAPSPLWCTANSISTCHAQPLQLRAAADAPSYTY